LIEPVIEGIPIEPIPLAIAAAANAALHEPVQQFPMAPQADTFGTPIPVPAEHNHHEQEDYLWGV
jgi:hypothetical protein